MNDSFTVDSKLDYKSIANHPLDYNFEFVELQGIKDSWPVELAPEKTTKLLNTKPNGISDWLDDLL